MAGATCDMRYYARCFCARIFFAIGLRKLVIHKRTHSLNKLNSCARRKGPRHTATNDVTTAATQPLLTSRLTSRSMTSLATAAKNSSPPRNEDAIRNMFVQRVTTDEMSYRRVACCG